MEIDDAQITEQLQHIRDFEAQLGVAKGFFEALLRENDWSFLIKIHALVEAGATNVIVEAMGKPELRNHFAQLPLSDSNYGKLSLLKELDVLSGPYRGFVRKLSELRNQAVHNVNQTSLDLKQMCLDAPKDKRKALAETLGVGLKASSEIRLGFLLSNPKFLIWVSSLCLISLLAIHKNLFKGTNDLSILGQQALGILSKTPDA